MKIARIAFLTLAAVATTACSSLDGQIRELESEERDLMDEIETLTNRRRAITKLITALEQHRDRDTRETERELEEAREDYDLATARAD